MPFYGFEEVFAIAISDREPLAPDPDFLILDEVHMKRVDDIGFVKRVKFVCAENKGNSFILHK